MLPRVRFNEARSFIAGGLQDVSLSRAKLNWGVPVPWDPEHVFYVWFDALLNYYTALSYARDGEDLTDTFWPADFHVIGKDILKFHAVFWPAMLLAADLPLPEHLFIHGFLLMKDAAGESKMSKSLGNVLDPFEVIDQFGTDALRYYCFREVSFGHDGSVSTTTFGERYDGRAGQRVRQPRQPHAHHDRPLPRRQRPRRSTSTPSCTPDFAGLADEVAELLDRAEITQALDAIWQRVRRLNRYVEEKRAVEAGQGPRAAPTSSTTTLRSLAEGLRVRDRPAARPTCPRPTAKLLAALGDERTRRSSAPAFGAGARRRHAIGELPPLFPKPQ